MKSGKCDLCGVHDRAHKKANFKPKKKGRSGLKPLKPRANRVRRWEAQ